MGNLTVIITRQSSYSRYVSVSLPLLRRFIKPAPGLGQMQNQSWGGGGGEVGVEGGLLILDRGDVEVYGPNG